LWFNTCIGVKDIFETGFLLFLPTQKDFRYIPYENMDNLGLMIGPWFEPLKID